MALLLAMLAKALAVSGGTREGAVGADEGVVAYADGWLIDGVAAYVDATAAGVDVAGDGCAKDGIAAMAAVDAAGAGSGAGLGCCWLRAGEAGEASPLSAICRLQSRNASLRASRCLSRPSSSMCGLLLVILEKREQV